MGDRLEVVLVAGAVPVKDHAEKEAAITAAAASSEALSYDEFLAGLDLQDKKDELADCGLDEGLELLQLAEMDNDDLESDFLDDEDLRLTDETKAKFRVAVAALGSAEDTKEKKKALEAELKAVQEEDDRKIAAKEANPSEQTFDGFLAGLNLLDRKDDLAEYLEYGVELRDLEQMS